VVCGDGSSSSSRNFDAAEFGFFYRFTSHCNSRRRGIWFFFLPSSHCNSRFRDVLSCSGVKGEENQIPRRRELQDSKRGGRREFKLTHIQSSLAETRASSYFEVPHVQRYEHRGETQQHITKQRHVYCVNKPRTYIAEGTRWTIYWVCTNRCLSFHATVRLLAWLAKNPPMHLWPTLPRDPLGFSQIPGHCATQCRVVWSYLTWYGFNSLNKFGFHSQPRGPTHTSSTRAGRDQTSQRRCSPSAVARSRAQAASGCRRARATAIHGGAESAVAALVGASGVKMMRWSALLNGGVASP